MHPLPFNFVGLTLNANEEVPRLSPCPPPPPPATMLSKFFGGKFKYLNRKNSEFLAGNSNTNVKCKMQMQMQMQNAIAKCKMQNAKCRFNAEMPIERGTSVVTMSYYYSYYHI